MDQINPIDFLNTHTVVINITSLLLPFMMCTTHKTEPMEIPSSSSFSSISSSSASSIEKVFLLEINLTIIYLFILSVIFFTKIALPYVRSRAFDEVSLRDKDPSTHRVGFIGTSPGFDFRGIHQTMVHTPIFLVQLIPFAFIKFPLFLFKTFAFWLSDEHGRLEREPSDEDICNYALNTPIYILAKIVIDEVSGKELIKYEIPSGTHIEKQCRGGIGAVIAGSCLHFTIDPLDKRIVSATVLKDFVGSHLNKEESECVRVDLATLASPKQTRNDILMSALHLIVTVWIHPSTHRLAELNAMEIREKKIDILEPSSRFVESLHEGLLLGKLSPASDNDSHPLHTGIYSTQLRVTIAAYPIPPHFVGDVRKLKYSKTFEFLFKMRAVLFKLVKKYNIQVNVEYLFHNLIVHAIDHYIVYKSLSDMNLRVSMNGSCTFRSYVEMFLYQDYWLTPKHNFVEEERTKYIDAPFYKYLYYEASHINKDYADEMVTSCSF